MKPIAKAKLGTLAFRHVTLLLRPAAALLVWSAIAGQTAESVTPLDRPDPLTLIADDDPARPNTRLGDYRSVKWVQEDRAAAPVTWRDRSWSDWLRRTGELPPDFDRLPSHANLPDPLRDDPDGTGGAIATAEAWPERREAIARVTQHWITGTFPPPPGNLTAEILEEKDDGDLILRKVLLRFGPGRQGQLHLRLFFPRGATAAPVLVTQSNESWIRRATARGYIGCMYAATERNDDTEAYGRLYPDYEFSRLMRRAWGCSRAIDYLQTLAEVDPARIALIGHSRNGFQALLAAAFDRRIAAVIPASSTVGLVGFRYSDPRYNSQSLDEFTYAFPYWLHPRLRFFVGREDRAPIDMNSVLALVAPRPLLLTAGIREPDANPWGLERVFDSVQSVYRLLGAEEKVVLRHRDGNHAVPPGEFDLYLDFIDTALGRSEAFHRHSRRIFTDSFATWQAGSGESLDPLARPEASPRTRFADRAAWPPLRAEILGDLAWLLGEPPPDLSAQPLATRVAATVVDEAKLNRQAVALMPFDTPRIRREKILIGPLSLGGNAVTAWHVPASGRAPNRPVVIFLHGYAYGNGFILRHGPFIERLCAEGVDVVTLDLFGFHSRIEEGIGFYERHPRWSRLGKMVFDLRSLISGLQSLDEFRGRPVFLCGVELGGIVALLTGATDERVAGVATFAALAPWRRGEARSATLHELADAHALVPRLGFFTGHESHAPIDIDEIAACIAPRPLLVQMPAFARGTDAKTTAASAEDVRRVYAAHGATERFTFEQPPNFRRFTSAEKEAMVQWVLRNAAAATHQKP